MLSLSVYVGPYVLVYKPYVVSLVDECEKHNRGKFDKYCRECGASMEERYKKTLVPKFTSCWEDTYKHKHNEKIIFDDMLFQADIREYISITDIPIGEEITKTCVYVPNRHYKELEIEKLNSENNRIISIDNNAIPICKIKSLFVDLFKEELNHIRKYFFAETRFGVVIHMQ